MTYHIIFWADSTFDEPNADSPGACVFFKHGCRCFTLKCFHDWDKILSSSLLESTPACMGYLSKKEKLDNNSNNCSDFWDGKLNRRNENPEITKILSLVTVHSKKEALAVLRSNILAGSL